MLDVQLELNAVNLFYYEYDEDPKMREEDLEVAIKVVIVGNGAVGKSSMIQRYCKGTFTKDYKKTIGVDFLERQIECDGEEVRLMLWDTAGQEEFDAITKAYYRGAQACVLAFSTTDRDSFDAIQSWKKKVEDECGEIPTVLVQNKMDLMDQSVIEPEEVELVARALGCRVVHTSVKEDVNVNTVFRHLASRCLADLRASSEEDYSLPSNYLHPPLSMSAFEAATQGSKSQYGNGTIVLRSSKSKNRKKKNIFRSTCRIL